MNTLRPEYQTHEKNKKASPGGVEPPTSRFQCGQLGLSSQLITAVRNNHYATETVASFSLKMPFDPHFNSQVIIAMFTEVCVMLQPAGTSEQ
jgi:hypothetical protein